MSPRTVALLAGGLGTRVEVLSHGKVPKALLAVAGRPFIDHKMEEFQRLGVERVVMLLGTHAEQIVDHVGDGSPWGLDVETVLDGDRLLGTGGSIKRALPELPERFWVTYGDTLLDADLTLGEMLVVDDPAAGVMTVLRNEDRWETSNVSVVAGLVSEYEKASAVGSHHFIDYGYLLLPRTAISAVADAEFDLRVALAPMIALQELHALQVVEPFHEIGTPESLRATEAWLRSREVSG